MKCNSQADLHLEMARVYEMCKGTAFEGKEYLCVKQKSGVFFDLPRFSDKPDTYEFALDIVEDKLVWEGDTLFTASGITFVVRKGNVFEGCSWNKPAPPKPKTVSISVNGKEPIVLVLPDGAQGDPMEFVFRHPYRWTNFAEMQFTEKIIRNLLEGKL